MTKRQRMCKDEKDYRAIIGKIREATDNYADGDRSGNTLGCLAQGKVLSDNIGESMPTPIGWDMGTWSDILGKLVSNVLGDYRCLNCYETGHADFTGPAGGLVHSADNWKLGIIGHRPDGSPLGSIRCGYCGSFLTEPIMCCAGVV